MIITYQRLKQLRPLGPTHQTMGVRPSWHREWFIALPHNSGSCCCRFSEHYIRSFRRATTHVQSKKAYQKLSETLPVKPSPLTAKLGRVPPIASPKNPTVPSSCSSYLFPLFWSVLTIFQLEELARSTAPAEGCLDSLDQALDEISSLATNMNEGKRESESRSKLVQWQSRIRGKFPSPLVQPHR